jgi:hypothetical protein
MTAKKRKPLDDALAREFVYAESSQNEPVTQAETQQDPKPAPVTKPASTQEATKSSLVSQLQQVPKEPTIRLTVDLTESMHRKLSVLAAKTGRKKVEIVRLLLDEALEEVEE